MGEPIRVGVLGARGRMGQQVCKAVDAADDLELVAMVDAGDWLFSVADAGSQVLVDFTHPDVVMDNIRFAIDQGIHAVVGTTGFTAGAARHRARAGSPTRHTDVGVLVAPELRHRRGAVDDASPSSRHASTTRPRSSSCTTRARRTRRAALPCARPQLIAEARGAAGRATCSGCDHHSRSRAREGPMSRACTCTRCVSPGMVAHQEIVFGAEGETLTIRHDSLDRVSFMPGVLLAVRNIASRPGLTVGLEALLDL